MPMAKQARQIWTEKLGLAIVHPLPFSGVVFREIGYVATIPIFWSNKTPAQAFTPPTDEKKMAQSGYLCTIYSLTMPSTAHAEPDAGISWP